MRRTLIVFVKWPEPGAVKTRLAADLGAELAARVYRGLAEAEIAGTRPLAGEYERLFLFAPPAARPSLEAWLPGETLLPQARGDLGARMSAAFDRAFAGGADQVAVVGTDVPWVARVNVLEAFEALASADYAIGPCDDGGYYLLVLSRPQPGLFSGVAWSTPGVLEATLERAGALGLRGAVLGRLPDVDTLDDLRRTWGALSPLLPAELVARVENHLRWRTSGPVSE